ncbi:MAG: hypothetical protein AB1609_23580 [Bacillota bacterium]
MFAGIRPELYAAKLALLDRHAAPYPTAQVLTWLAERIDQILDRNPYSVKQGRTGSSPRSSGLRKGLDRGSCV